jgi:hypothetical protein
MSHNEMDLPRRSSDHLDEIERYGKGAPAFAELIPRYESHAMALNALTESLLPPNRHVRSYVVVTVAYGFADASGKGFGRTIIVDGCLIWRSGQWKEF